MTTPTTPRDASFWNARFAAGGFFYGTAPNDYLAGLGYTFTRQV